MAFGGAGRGAASPAIPALGTGGIPGERAAAVFGVRQFGAVRGDRGGDVFGVSAGTGVAAVVR